MYQERGPWILNRKALTKACAFTQSITTDHQKEREQAFPSKGHLLQVAGSVFEHGGDVEQAIAALCHDTLEDCDEVDFKLGKKFLGNALPELFKDCTDTFEADTPDQKSLGRTPKSYLALLAKAAKDSVLVAACDKLHNLSCIVADVDTHGPTISSDSTAPLSNKTQYFSTFLENTRDRLPKRLILRFEETLLAYQKQIAPTPPPNRQ